MSLQDRAQDITYLGHSLVFPKQTKPNKLVNVFTEWLKQEMGKSDALDVRKLNLVPVTVRKSASEWRADTTNRTFASAAQVRPYFLVPSPSKLTQ